MLVPLISTLNSFGPVPLDYFQDRAQILSDFSLALILGAGWFASFFLIGLGRHFRQTRAVAVGSIGLGVMTVATSLTAYIPLLLQRGGFVQASLFDLALVSFLGFVGGIISTVAFLRIWINTSEAKTKI